MIFATSMATQRAHPQAAVLSWPSSPPRTSPWPSEAKLPLPLSCWSNRPRNRAPPAPRSRQRPLATRAHSSTPDRLCSLAAARGDCARAGKCRRSHPKQRGPPHRRGRRSRHGKNCPNPHAPRTSKGLRPRFPIPPCLAPRRPHHRRQDAALPGSRNTATSRRRSSSAKSLVAGGL